ncbi:bifunctional methylenetetrahydrofolate dehydrogenase/methenyltetrahydrofolate cyclohydrolase FolD [Nocardioides sp. NPDC127503]|uniref:bifunctional methylenetetrahydrofolate dehydrogenase/methenyltetrahydrofolate cyclohydrolase FolD n=1 Tax=Nocardioides sp. NPDC127503 TaxID=3154516 RepID=UPI00332079A7
MATLIDGKKIAQDVRDNVRRDVADFVDRTGIRPALATVLVGGDPASAVYVASKRKACVVAGMVDRHHHLEAHATQTEVEDLLDALAVDTEVSGILLQLPLPGHLDREPLIDRIPSVKDVDGLGTLSAGLLAQGKHGLRPCTPLGVMELLARLPITLEGASVVVVGRSALVGRPLAQMLVQANATVTVAHSRTRDLGAITRGAQVLVAAAGVPGLIGAEHVSEGTTVVDVGIHRTPDGLVGDVSFDEVEPKASFITPVPGGVGPMTIAMLLRNTLNAAELQWGG